MFGIISQDRTVFKKNFLRSITFNSSYASTPQCTELREQFKNLFSDVMPKTDEMDGTRLLFKDKDVFVQKEENAKQLTLRSNDVQRSMTLTNEACSYVIAGSQYKCSDELRTQYKKALMFLQTCGIKKMQKISLRKQNILQFNIKSAKNESVPSYEPLRKIMSENLLLQYNNINAINPFISQSIQTLQLEDNGYLLTIRYGYRILNKGSENTESNGLVIIDLDISKQEVPIDDVANIFDTFNTEIYNAFIWSLSEDFLNSLKSDE